MIGAAALAYFAGRYPDQPACFQHELAAHPLAARPLIATMIRQVPPGGIRRWDPQTVSFVAGSPGESTALLDTDEDGMPPAAFRLLGLDSVEPYGAWSQEILKFIGPLLSGTSRNLAFMPPVLDISARGVEAATRAFASHTIHLVLHGSLDCQLWPGASQRIYGKSTNPDGADGLIVSDVTEAGEPETIRLDQGDALFIPARTAYKMNVDDGPATRLVIRWMTEDLAVNEASARLRQRLGMAARPAQQVWLARVERQINRLLGDG